MSSKSAVIAGQMRKYNGYDDDNNDDNDEGKDGPC